jgi:hypothetical protein
VGAAAELADATGLIKGLSVAVLRPEATHDRGVLRCTTHLAAIVRAGAKFENGQPPDEAGSGREEDA